MVQASDVTYVIGKCTIKIAGFGYRARVRI
jgi:hypothetical protein